MTLESLAHDHLELFRIRGGEDSTMDATVRSNQLRRDRQSPIPAVILIGDKRWGRAVEESILNLDFDDMELIDLTTVGQTLWESEALIDWTSNRTGIVILDASLRRFLEPASRLKRLASHPKLGFRSRAFDREIDSAGLPTRSLYDRYLLDNVSFFVDRWPNAILNTTLGKQVVASAPNPSPNYSRLQDGIEADQSFELNKKAFGRFMEIATRKTKFTLIVLSVDPPDAPARLLEERNKLIAHWTHSSRIDAMTSGTDALSSESDRLVTMIRDMLDAKHE